MSRRLIPYVSPTLTLAAGKSNFLDRDFVDYEGPMGLRNVIHYMDVIAVITLDSVTTGTIQGEDFADGVRNTFLEDRYGRRIDLNGQPLRAFNFMCWGEKLPAEPSDQAPSVTEVTATYRHRIALALPFMERPEDFALPADEFRLPGHKLRFQAAGNTDIQISSGSYILDAAGNAVAITVTAWCAEEYAFERKARWTALMDSTKNDARFVIPGIAERPILFLGLRKDGASGGADFANLTAVDAKRLGWINVEDAELEEGYRIQHCESGVQKSKDPWDHVGSDAANSNGMPLVWVPQRAKITQCLILGGSPEIVVTESSAITDKEIMKVFVTPPDMASAQLAAAGRGIDLSATRVKTIDGKTVADDDPFAPFLPQKLSGRAGAYSSR